MRILYRFRLVALGPLTLAACAAAGCNGNVAQLAGCPSSNLANNGVPQLLYPISGTQGLADSLSAILIAFNGAASKVNPIQLRAAGNPSTAIGPALSPPAKLPSPRAGTPPGWSMYSVSLPTLSAHTAYTLSYTYATSYNSCTGEQNTTSTVGHFTTQ
jgi:hypothetical protein